MQKLLLYDTDDGLNINFSCIPTDKPWVSCQIFRVHDQEDIYFEVIKSEEYLIEDYLAEKSIGTFTCFKHAVESAERIAHMYRVKNHWPAVTRTIQ